MQSIRFDTHTQRGEAVNNEYAVSIRRRYIMPDHTFDGYELVLWHWDVIENTWLFRATRDYPISKRVSRGYALWKVLRDAQKLARIFAIVAAIFTSNPQDKEEHHGNERE